MRRFLQSVRIQEQQSPHSGLGLQSYVQWSSPIRRFSDLQVHASVKRYLRRRRFYELILQNETIPDGIRAIDLGISNDVFEKIKNHAQESSWNLSPDATTITINDLDQDLNFSEGLGLITAGKNLQRLSQKYWLFEYIRRTHVTDPTRVYPACVLGCIDTDRQQYAIYVYDLGLEHRYVSPIDNLKPGTNLQLKVDTVTPRAGLLNFVRVV
jgi:RNB domain